MSDEAPRLVVADTLLAKSNRTACLNGDACYSNGSEEGAIKKNEVSFALKRVVGKKGKAQYCCLACVRKYSPLGDRKAKEEPPRLEDEPAHEKAGELVTAAFPELSEASANQVTEALALGERVEQEGKEEGSTVHDEAVAAAKAANEAIAAEMVAAAAEKRKEAAKKRKAEASKKTAAKKKRKKDDDSEDEAEDDDDDEESDEPEDDDDDDE